jgi:hypothetical protein
LSSVFYIGDVVWKLSQEWKSWSCHVLKAASIAEKSYHYAKCWLGVAA